MQKREPQSQKAMRQSRLNRRAEREELLDKLERFVRLSGERSEFEWFTRLYAFGFFPPAPASVDESPDWRGQAKLDRTQDHSQARIRALRKLQSYLQDVWRGKDSSGYKLSSLLGLITPGDFRDMPGTRWMVSLNTACAIANWSEGRFTYKPACGFQKAVYLLFQESWRAKTCQMESCRKLFIANQKAQKYCTTACSGEAQKARGLSWWNRVGSGRRKVQSAKSAGSKSRKRGAK